MTTAFFSLIRLDFIAAQLSNPFIFVLTGYSALFSLGYVCEFPQIYRSRVLWISAMALYVGFGVVRFVLQVI